LFDAATIVSPKAYPGEVLGILLSVNRIIGIIQGSILNKVVILIGSLEETMHTVEAMHPLYMSLTSGLSVIVQNLAALRGSEAPITSCSGDEIFAEAISEIHSHRDLLSSGDKSKQHHPAHPHYLVLMLESRRVGFLHSMMNAEYIYRDLFKHNHSLPTRPIDLFASVGLSGFDKYLQVF